MEQPTRYDSLSKALENIDIPPAIAESLALVEVPHIDFEGHERTGQLVIHKDLAGEVQEIFKTLHQNRFPIHKIVPIVAYGWDDEASMNDNNTSAFNYRVIVGTDKLSNHSYGRSIDINPMQNPYYARNEKTYPETALYNEDAMGTLTADSMAVRTFKKFGWTWLGERKEHTDYQHFEKQLQ